MFMLLKDTFASQTLIDTYIMKVQQFYKKMLW